MKARVNSKTIHLQIAESLQKGIKKTISASGKQFNGSNFVKYYVLLMKSSKSGVNWFGGSFGGASITTWCNCSNGVFHEW